MDSTGRRVPRNTTADHRRNPLGFLGAALAMGTSAAIEEQESKGQRSFVDSDTLPINLRDDGRAVLEAWGVTFHGGVEGDSLFQYVTLPAGWKKQATDHSMWSHLVDDKGRKRASIFYKAAFYDRNALLNPESRYQCSFNYSRAEEKREAVCEVFDGATVIFTAGPEALPVQRDETYWAVQERVREVATKWLNETYPRWQDAAAYWDDETAAK